MTDQANTEGFETPGPLTQQATDSEAAAGSTWAYEFNPKPAAGLWAITQSSADPECDDADNV